MTSQSNLDANTLSILFGIEDHADTVAEDENNAADLVYAFRSTVPPTVGLVSRHGHQHKQRALWRRQRSTARPQRQHRIVLHIADAARRAGFATSTGHVNVAALCRDSGLSRATVWALVHQPAAVQGISLSTLGRLCDVLRVQPGDLVKIDGLPVTPGGPLLRRVS